MMIKGRNNYPHQKPNVDKIVSVHVDIIMLHVDMIYLAFWERGQKYFDIVP